MTQAQAQQLAILSLLDVVQEVAVKVGDPDWADVVISTFDEHRNQIRESE
jgi:hypothetical protein